MAYVDLDKIINVSGWGGSVYPGGDDPAPYPVLTQSIGIFNKPDARDGDSNGWFGLLNNSNNAINAQNNNWNTQMAVATAIWTGALSTHVKSFDFSTTIAQIDSGKIKWALFKNTTVYDTLVTFNEWTKKLKKISPSAVQITGQTAWSHIITSWGNRFLLAWGNIFPLDADNNVTWAATGTYLWQVVSTVGNTVRTLQVSLPSINDVTWHIYTIDATWVATEINNVLVYDWSSTAYGTSVRWWYQLDNTICHTLIWHYTGTGWDQDLLWEYITIDLTNTTTFTFTVISDWRMPYNLYGSWTNHVWYDWVGLIFAASDTFWNTLIRRATSAWVENLWTYHGEASMWKTWSLTYWTDKTTTISASSTKLNILWTNVGWENIAPAWISWLYEMTWALSQDDCLIWAIISDSYIPFWEDDPLEITINWIDITGYDNAIFVAWANKTVTLTTKTIWDVYIDAKISTPNFGGRDLCIALWATWWTYATPTLPANNGMTSGSATTPRVAGTDASYINLTLSA